MAASSSACWSPKPNIDAGTGEDVPGTILLSEEPLRCASNSVSLETCL